MNFTAGLLNAAADIRNDILHLFKPGVVCGDDGQIRHAAANLPHRVTTVLRAVSTAAKDYYQTLRMVLLRCQKALHADCVVGVVYDDAALLRRCIQSPYGR